MSKTYLFPFNEVKKDSKIIIYGGGDIGRQLIEQLSLIKYCDCLFVVDKNFKEIQQIDGIKVCEPKKINDHEFDKIIIASSRSDYIAEIYNLLRNYNVPDKKIIKNLPIYRHKRILVTPDPKNSNAWDNYYAYAENCAQKQFEFYLKPILSEYKDLNFTNVLDFACGHGRIANIFSEFSKKITCCDVNATAIEFCKERFSASNKCSFEFANNEVASNSLQKMPFQDSTFTFIYSWDAMVHFSYKWVDYYLKEFYRILSDNSYAIIHHSNYAEICDFNHASENWFDNSAWRGFVSHNDIRFIAENHGFDVVKQSVIDWEQSVKLDCISILKKQK